MGDLRFKILFKIYTKDVLGSVRRRLFQDSNTKSVSLFLDSITKSHLMPYEIMGIANKCFKGQKSYFSQLCFKLISQIVLEPNTKVVSLETEILKYNWIPLMIKISDYFGRFDLGLDLRKYYCKSLENEAFKDARNRRSKILYSLHKQLFGVDYFEMSKEKIDIIIPFYLASFSRKISKRWDTRSQHLKQIDFYFKNKINNKSIALLAPGILFFDETLVEQLNEFDEIIPLSYTYEHYKDLAKKINISYYNTENSKRLIIDKEYSSEIDLEVYCLKTRTTKGLNQRQILLESYKWFFGGPNMGQVAIYDLLCNEPKMLKVFGMNFFLSNQPYHKKYQSKLNTQSLADHNIVSNFLYVKKLFSENLIELDQDAFDIVNNGVEAYVEKMTKQFRLI